MLLTKSPDFVRVQVVQIVKQLSLLGPRQVRNERARHCSGWKIWPRNSRALRAQGGATAGEGISSHQSEKQGESWTSRGYSSARQHWAIVDLVGKGGHTFEPCLLPNGSKKTSSSGWPQPEFRLEDCSDVSVGQANSGVSA